jgi:zinc and cadmium transporter
LALNLLSSLTSIVGGVGAYLLLPLVQPAVPYIMAVSAASFIYIALADLIPGLHRNLPLRDSVMQVVLIVAGIATIAMLHH